jgi:Na+-driven multidrug efflux pump
MFSLLETLILLLINQQLLSVTSSPVEHTSNETLNAYYQKVHDLQIGIAQQLTIIYSASLLIPMLITYFASLIRAEGKFKIVVGINIICNVINIGLTIFLVLVAKIDAYSGSTSTLICYLINFTALMFYLSHLNHKNQT